jgi:hypothetical protein
VFFVSRASCMTDLIITVSTSPRTRSGASRAGELGFAITVLLGAFLLFSVQLVLAKFFLPWFGGTPAVWTTCMFFFQILLLAGYAYAHLLATRLELRKQARTHSVLLLLATGLLVWLALIWHSPLMPDSSWKPTGGELPLSRLIQLLFVSAGVPYFMLSATGPLFQSWFSATHPGRSPYRLYALSNLGSVLALLSYPFFIEPLLSLRMQARLWTFGFLLYVLVCGYVALRIQRPARLTCDSERAVDFSERPRVGQALLWFSLAMSASVLFLATTNRISQDIGIVPFLWVVPLSLYLTSFIICFDKPTWYSRRLFHSAFVVGIFLACLVLNGWGMTNIKLQIAAYSFALFASCMVCHGELARSKPSPQFLTSFYLTVALGGAGGGVFVALIAPRLFSGFWEYQIGLWVTTLLLLLVLGSDRTSYLHSNLFGLGTVALAAALLPGVTALPVEGKRAIGGLATAIPVLIAVYFLIRWGEKGESKARQRAVSIFSVAALLVLAGTLLLAGRSQLQGAAVSSSRNFYGVLSVRQFNSKLPESRFFSLYHGRISHGLQFDAPAKRLVPTLYFAKTSGVGRTLIQLQENQSHLRVGVVGLGIGTLAAYGRPVDSFHFYEINPEVIRIAHQKEYFTYLSDCPATVDIVPGDARLSMERELTQGRSQQFDLLILDAFSGDAIPLHLLTSQAFETYLKEVKRTHGIIAVHITNTYLDLRPVLMKAAERFGLSYAFLHTDGDNVYSNYSDWVLLSYDQEFLDSVLTPLEKQANVPGPSSFSLWTDDYSNLLQVLRK